MFDMVNASTYIQCWPKISHLRMLSISQKETADRIQYDGNKVLTKYTIRSSYI